MKWVNIGTVEEWDMLTNKASTVDVTDSQTGKAIRNPQNNECIIRKNIEGTPAEIWVSFDLKLYETSLNVTYGGLRIGFKDTEGNSIYLYEWEAQSNLFKVAKSLASSSSYQDTIVYTPEKTLDFYSQARHNLEIHLLTGATASRIDVWYDHKLAFSYRAPDLCTNNIKQFFFYPAGSCACSWEISSIIIQDTRRIGYEKFVKLNISPDTEQNMPQGSTTNFTLSGLSDSAEYSDITGVCAVLQATSRDANITTGTYTLEGADVGTIDVSDSSGKAYETAYAESNNVTGLPWTRDDIEGKTLSFTVNGAS